MRTSGLSKIYLFETDDDEPEDRGPGANPLEPKAKAKPVLPSVDMPGRFARTTPQSLYTPPKPGAAQRKAVKAAGAADLKAMRAKDPLMRSPQTQATVQTTKPNYPGKFVGQSVSMAGKFIPTRTAWVDRPEKGPYTGKFPWDPPKDMPHSPPGQPGKMRYGRPGQTATTRNLVWNGADWVTDDEFRQSGPQQSAGGPKRSTEPDPLALARLRGRQPAASIEPTPRPDDDVISMLAKAREKGKKESWWHSAFSVLSEADVKSELNAMMTTKRFSELVALAKAEKWTDDDRMAAFAVLSAMIVYNEPQRQAKYVKAYLSDKR